MADGTSLGLDVRAGEVAAFVEATAGRGSARAQL